MLPPFLCTMNNNHPDSTRVILASASPRRRDLIRYLGLAPRAIATDAEDSDETPPDAVVAALPYVDVPLLNHPVLLGWRKAAVVAAAHPDCTVIGADTIVVLDGNVLNKPTDPAHAEHMLALLSGRVHTVYTGVVVLAPQHQPLYGVEQSHVMIALLDAATIAAYVATGEPLDKAGAYGIQGLGGRLVQQVDGSYTNVVGLPLPLLTRMLAACGAPPPVDANDAYVRWLHDQGKEPLPCPPTSP